MKCFYSCSICVLFSFVCIVFVLRRCICWVVWECGCGMSDDVLGAFWWQVNGWWEFDECLRVGWQQQGSPRGKRVSVSSLTMFCSCCI